MEDSGRGSLPRLFALKVSLDRGAFLDIAFGRSVMYQTMCLPGVQLVVILH